MLTASDEIVSALFLLCWSFQYAKTGIWLRISEEDDMNLCPKLTFSWHMNILNFCQLFMSFMHIWKMYVRLYSLS